MSENITRYNAEIELAKLRRRLKAAGWQAAWLVLVGAGTVWYGWVLMVLWGWFAVPTFRAPALSLPVAIGLSLIAKLWIGTSNATDLSKSEGERFAHACVWAITYPLMSLGIGWLAHLA